MDAQITGMGMMLIVILILIIKGKRDGDKG